MLCSYDDVVDWDMNEFDEEPDEAHYGKTDSSGQCNLLEFFSVWLGTPLHQPDGVLGELSHWLNCSHNLVHSRIGVGLLSKIRIECVDLLISCYLRTSLKEILDTVAVTKNDY